MLFSQNFTVTKFRKWQIFNSPFRMTFTRVAIVTGGNKGIGYAIVQGLAKQFDGDVYLTARNPKLGMESVSKLLEAGRFGIMELILLMVARECLECGVSNLLSHDAGLKVHFHQLDINDKASAERLRDFMKEKYGGIDILVNNAGMAFKAYATEPMSVQV